jgi:hypothetical protein
MKRFKKDTPCHPSRLRASHFGGPPANYRGVADRGFHVYATTVADPYSGWMLLPTPDVDRFDEEWDELFGVPEGLITTELEREWAAELTARSKVERAVPPATTAEGLGEYLRLPREARLAARDATWLANSPFPPPAWFVKHFEEEEKRRFESTLNIIVRALVNEGTLPKDAVVTTIAELFSAVERNQK